MPLAPFFRNSLTFLSALASSFFIFPLHAALVDIKEQDEIVYALYSAPNKIVRYDLTQERFLSEISLSIMGTCHLMDKCRRLLNGVSLPVPANTFIAGGN